MTPSNNILIKSMLQVGTLLHNGKYKIERYLSSGGFGNTYIAIDTSAEKAKVVLKEFFIRGVNERGSNNLSISVSNKNNLELFQRQRGKFWREAQRIHLLHHPNIVGVYDRFKENGTAYYVMEFIDGESVSDILKRNKHPYSEERALEIISKVADALSVVHSQSMYHLDIKPGNIMIDSQGEVKLIDFGASKQLATDNDSSISSSTSGFCFTPGYAPNEQMSQQSKNIGPWTDLYALGGTLYNLLTMLPPPNVFDIFEDEEHAFKFPENVSEHTRQLVYWMMHPLSMMRPQSAKELLTAIHGGKVPARSRKKVMVITPSPTTLRPDQVVEINDTIIENTSKEVVSKSKPIQEKRSKKTLFFAIGALVLLQLVIISVYGIMSIKGTHVAAIDSTASVNISKTDSAATDSAEKAKEVLEAPPIVGTLTAYYAKETFGDYKKGELIVDSNDPINRMVDYNATNFKYEGDDTGVYYSELIPKNKVIVKTYTMNELPITMITHRLTYKSNKGDFAYIFSASAGSKRFYTYDNDYNVLYNKSETQKYRQHYALVAEINSSSYVFQQPLTEKNGYLNLYAKNPYGDEGCRHRNGRIGIIEEIWVSKDSSWEGYLYKSENENSYLATDLVTVDGIIEHFSIAYIANLQALYFEGELYFLENP